MNIGPSAQQMALRPPPSVLRPGQVWWAGRGRSGCERTASALQSYRKSSRHLAPFIHKFVHFTHKYVTCNAPAAVSFLQKHADALQ